MKITDLLYCENCNTLHEQDEEECWYCGDVLYYGVEYGDFDSAEELEKVLNNSGYVIDEFDDFDDVMEYFEVEDTEKFYTKDAVDYANKTKGGRYR